jgi:hypothetical protein
MRTLQQHLDLIAILVLALILGIGHAPRMRSRIIRADWERPAVKSRVLQFNKLIHHIPAR